MTESGHGECGSLNALIRRQSKIRITMLMVARKLAAA
jgi:hypothetical protein